MMIVAVWIVLLILFGMLAFALVIGKPPKAEAVPVVPVRVQARTIQSPPGSVAKKQETDPELAVQIDAELAAEKAPIRHSRKIGRDKLEITADEIEDIALENGVQLTVRGAQIVRGRVLFRVQATSGTRFAGIKKLQKPLADHFGVEVEMPYYAGNRKTIIPVHMRTIWQPESASNGSLTTAEAILETHRQYLNDPPSPAQAKALVDRIENIDENDPLIVEDLATVADHWQQKIDEHDGEFLIEEWGDC